MPLHRHDSERFESRCSANECVRISRNCFDHHKRTVSITQKTRAKLHDNLPRVTFPLTVRHILQLFGVAQWATSVMLTPHKSELYYIYKLVRRAARFPLNNLVHIWPSTAPLWLR